MSQRTTDLQLETNTVVPTCYVGIDVHQLHSTIHVLNAHPHLRHGVGRPA